MRPQQIAALRVERVDMRGLIADISCGLQRDGSRAGACASDSAGKHNITNTQDAENTEADKPDLRVLCVRCGGEFIVIVSPSCPPRPSCAIIPSPRLSAA